MNLFDATQPLAELGRALGIWPPKPKHAYRRIRFKDGSFADMELILMEDGAICTYEQLSNWECTVAHMKPDGRIARFQGWIGHRDTDVWIWWPLQLEDRQASWDDLECHPSNFPLGKP